MSEYPVLSLRTIVTIGTLHKIYLVLKRTQLPWSALNSNNIIFGFNIIFLEGAHQPSDWIQSCVINLSNNDLSRFGVKSKFQIW